MATRHPGSWAHRETARFPRLLAVLERLRVDARLRRGSPAWFVGREAQGMGETKTK
jgi:hypothetical protein